MKENKTICLCAIVRDESQIIERLINSCKSFVDYYVIVDTGSIDNTKDIIKKAFGNIPGEIHDRPWLNFGHNRSELMTLAFNKADYLLLADADFEYVVSEGFNKNSLKYDWYHLRYLGDLDFSQILLVSGYKKWGYFGVTHEYIMADGCGESPELSYIKIIHHADGAHRPEKLTRDRDLLEKAIIDDPGNTRNYFYLAQTYANMGEYEKALKYYEERAKRGGWQEEVYYSLFQIAVMQYHLKNINSSILQLIEAYSYRPTRFEALYMLGVIYREQKKYHIARMIQEEVLRMPYPESDMLFIHKNNKEYLADFELAIIYYWTGEYQKAKKHGMLVKSHNDIPEHIRKKNDDNLKFIDERIKGKESKKNDIIFVSMFTAGTPYEQEVKILQKSLDKFGIPYEIVGLRNQGSWEKNTQMKPQILKSVIDKYNKDVVWVDADAEIKEYPELFYTIDCDIAYHYIPEWNERMTGTLYFKNNTKSREILNKWVQKNSENNDPDAFNFQRVIEENEDKSIRFSDIPIDYICVQDIEYLKSSKPVIEHHQASRRFKHDVEHRNDSIFNSNIIKRELLSRINGNKECSVIGNGPFTSDYSKDIDRSFVLRCNNFKLGIPGIGTKTDVNISSLYHEIIPEGKVEYPIFGVLPISDSMYQQYTDAKMMHLYWRENGEKLIRLGNTVLMYGDKEEFAKVFSDVASKIKAFPTVGILGIAIARWLGFKKIIISGFTFFQTEKSHYFKEERIRPSSHHNPVAERELLLQWIAEDKEIKYTLDQLTWKNLYINASNIKSSSIK